MSLTKQVKVLAVLPLVDQGESDWKVIVIHHEDPMAPYLNNLADIERHFPGYISDTIRWFRMYKVPVGKPENRIAMNGYAQDIDVAMLIIDEVHNAWRHLLGDADRCTRDFSMFCNHTTCCHSGLRESAISRYRLDAQDATQYVAGPAPSEFTAPMPEELDQWLFVADDRLGDRANCV